MSLLIWAHEPDQFAIMTDTVATPSTGNGAWASRSKLWPVPHQNLVIGGTGSRELARRWHEYAAEDANTRDVEELDVFARMLLPDLLADLEAEHGGPLPGTSRTSTIYHFGITAEGCAVRYTYRSEHGFASELQTERELCEKPAPTDGRFIEFATLEDMIGVAYELFRQQHALPEDQRVHIGGDLHLTILRDGSITTERVHRYFGSDDAHLEILGGSLVADQ